jgi:hypothetical protein
MLVPFVWLDPFNAVSVNERIAMMRQTVPSDWAALGWALDTVTGLHPVLLGDFALVRRQPVN